MINFNQTQHATVFKKNIWIDIFIYCFLCFLGWISIFSIEYKPDQNTLLSLLAGKTNYSKQLIWILVSLFLGLLILNINSKIFASMAYPSYIIGCVLMVLTIFLGTNFRGSKSWLSIFGLFRFQVVQVLFLCTALALSKYLSTHDITGSKLKDKALPLALIVLPSILSIYQLETGMALVFSSFLIVLYREGISIILIILPIYLILTLVASIAIQPLTFAIVLTVVFFILLGTFKKFFFKHKAILALVIVVFVSTGLMQSRLMPYIIEKTLAPYQIKRLHNAFQSGEEKTDNSIPDYNKKKNDNYNVNQSIVAIGSGGFFGKGFLNNTQTRLDFVPEQSTDFIICSFAESFGFLGIFILLTTYLSLLIRTLTIAEKQRSIFSRCYAYGFVGLLFFHIFINLGMSVGLLPVIGIPLPFMSYGGGAIITFSVMYFILVRLDMDRQTVVK